MGRSVSYRVNSKSNIPIRSTVSPAAPIIPGKWQSPCIARFPTVSIRPKARERSVPLFSAGTTRWSISRGFNCPHCSLAINLAIDDNDSTLLPRRECSWLVACACVAGGVGGRASSQITYFTAVRRLHLIAEQRSLLVIMAASASHCCLPAERTRSSRKDRTQKAVGR